MARPEGLERALQERSGHLATVRPDGRPHVVVVTFAVTHDQIVTAIDRKPKTTERLQRLVNIEANPSVSFLVDHYEEDWDGLWWVRIDGRASIHASGRVWRDAIDALTARYGQYRKQRPAGPVIAIAQESVTSWASTP
ncbi:MAG: TIGR03668 family PPOX class F420-dependent oxidoreductase [Acidimicrobiia bacterium]